MLPVLGVVLLTRYGKLGDWGGYREPAIISVSGGAGGYTVSASHPEGAVWSDVYLFADSGTSLTVRASLMTFAGVTALVCDSSMIALAPYGGAASQFREKFELLVIPSFNEEAILSIRDLFRPRYLAVLPPCAMPSTQNIICETTDKNGGFRYDFEVKRGKLVNIY